MQSSLYVALSSQIALSRQLETIAGNVANSPTTGFRADQVVFHTLVSHTPSGDVAFASRGGTFVSRATGEIVRTDGALDIAVKGHGWLAVETSNGRAYTRDGRLSMAADGTVRTAAGHALLDTGGTPMQLLPSGGPVQIADDGSVRQGGRTAGVIGLFDIDPQAKVTRIDPSTVTTDAATAAPADGKKSSIVQGYLERTNANPILEMSKLITVQRSFEAISAAVSSTESTLHEAIRTLGGSS